MSLSARIHSSATHHAARPVSPASQHFSSDGLREPEQLGVREKLAAFSTTTSDGAGSLLAACSTTTSDGLREPELGVRCSKQSSPKGSPAAKRRCIRSALDVRVKPRVGARFQVCPLPDVQPALHEGVDDRADVLLFRPGQTSLESRGVRHWLIDVEPPLASSTAVQFTQALMDEPVLNFARIASRLGVEARQLVRHYYGDLARSSREGIAWCEVAKVLPKRCIEVEWRLPVVGGVRNGLDDEERAELSGHWLKARADQHASVQSSATSTKLWHIVVVDDCLPGREVARFALQPGERSHGLQRVDLGGLHPCAGRVLLVTLEDRLHQRATCALQRIAESKNGALRVKLGGGVTALSIESSSAAS